MRIASDLRRLLAYDGFARLFAVRILSQAADGFFQVGLAFLYFFNPTTLTSATSVAWAFALLLLPFTLIGPFVGPLLDRWSRQRVLLVGNAIRAVLCLGLATGIVLGWPTWAIAVLALVTLGINRFLLSALSAGLPHVVPSGMLLLANTLTPTLGAISVAVGGVSAVIINRLSPVGQVRDAMNLAVAAVVLACACWAATRIGRTELGPDKRSTTGVSVARVAADLGAGIAYLARRGTPGYALVVMAIHRFLYGVNLIALLLISRNLLNDPTDAEGGLATFALISGISFAGNALAIVATPLARTWVRPSTWIMMCVGLTVVSQSILVATWQVIPLCAAAVLLGLGVQGAKIAVDTIVQRDTADEMRGRAFALYDMGFNLAFVLAAVLAALLLPDTGWSPAVFVGLVALSILLIGWYRHVTTKVNDEPRIV